jgi:large repetitive protein
MKRKCIDGILTAGLVLGLMGQAAAFTAKKSTQTAGAGKAASASYVLKSTVGQPTAVAASATAQKVTSASYFQWLGFWQSNQTPVLATNSGMTLDQGATATLTNAMLNVTDVDNVASQITFTVGSAPANGTLKRHTTALGAGSTFTQRNIDQGDVTYVHGGGANSSDSFTFTVSDGVGGTIGSTTFSITVTSTNVDPVATAQTVTALEDGQVTVTLSGTDGDGDPITATISALPGSGSLFQTSDGTSAGSRIMTAGTTVTDASMRVIFVPESNASGTGYTTFGFQLNDGTVSSSSAVVTANVTAVNDAPIMAAIGSLSPIAEDAGPQAVSLSGIGTGASDESQTLSLTATSSNTDLIAAPVVTYTSGAATGVLTYTPNPDSSGTAMITVTITDDGGTTNGGVDTASQTFTVTVTPVSDAPVANNDRVTTTQHSAVDINVLANDRDPDGDALSVSEISSVRYGKADLSESGTVKFTPQHGFVGEASFAYSAADAGGDTDTGTVTITVLRINRDPVARADEAVTEMEQQVRIAVLENDSDPDGDPMTLVRIDRPQHGIARITDDKLAVIYTPEQGFIGRDSFLYTVVDYERSPVYGFVEVAVLGANTSPVVADDSVTVTGREAVDIPVLLNDSDPDGDGLTLSEIGEPDHGTVAPIDDRGIRYVPDEGFKGLDRFRYTVSDGRGGTATGEVTVRVTVPEGAPLAVADTVVTEEDEAVTIDVLANDVARADGGLEVLGATSCEHGSVTVNPDGTVRFVPAADFCASARFSYTISNSRDLTDIGVVVLSITPVNDAPEAGDDEAAADSGEPVRIHVLRNDRDVDGDPLRIVSVGNPAHGSVVLAEDSVLVYTPEADFGGDDEFAYTLADDQGATAAARVTVSVVRPNRAPMALDDTAGTSEDTPVSIDVLSNDLDPDGDLLTVVTVEPGIHGSVAVGPDGRVAFVPETGFIGEVTFGYTVSDGRDGSSSATVKVKVTERLPELAGDFNLDGRVAFEDFTLLTRRLGLAEGDEDYHRMFDLTEDGILDDRDSEIFLRILNGGSAENIGPVAVDDAVITTEGVEVLIDVLANDTDEDGDPLVVESVSEPSAGTTRMQDGRTVAYVPALGFDGWDAFTYTVTDGRGGASTASVTVEVALGPLPNPGDVNGDLVVGMPDFLLFMPYLNGQMGGAYDTRFDLNRDKRIDFSDFVELIRLFGAEYAASRLAKPVRGQLSVLNGLRASISGDASGVAPNRLIAAEVHLEGLPEDATGYAAEIWYDGMIMQLNRADVSGKLGRVLGEKPGKIWIGGPCRYAGTGGTAESATDRLHQEAVTERPVVRIEFRVIADGLPEGALLARVNELLVINAGGGMLQLQDREDFRYDAPCGEVSLANHPNPFNPVTAIRYELPDAGFVRLEIYDVTGQRVRTLAAEHTEAGRYEVRWAGRDEEGRDVSSGVYFLRLNTGAQVTVHKTLLLR